MPATDCNAWVPAESHGVGSGAIYELRYDLPAPILGPVDREPFEYALSGYDAVTLLSVRMGGMFGAGDPIARVVVHRSGPALQVLPDVLQVNREVAGDAVLELSEVRLCGYADNQEQEEAAEQERQRRREIENMDDAANPLGRLLEPFEDASKGAVVVAVGLLVLLLWPLLSDLLEGLTRAGTKLWD